MVHWASPLRELWNWHQLPVASYEIDITVPEASYEIGITVPEASYESYQQVHEVSYKIGIES